MNTSRENQPKTFDPESMDIGDSLQEAWVNIYGMKGRILAMSILIPGLVNFLLLMMGNVILRPWPIVGVPTFIIVAIFCILFSWYCVTTTILMGVKKALGMSVSIDESWNDSLRVGGKLFLLLFVYILVNVSLILLSSFFAFYVMNVLFKFLEYYVVTVVHIFCVPLIALKGERTFAAISKGMQMANQNIINILVCMIAMFIIIGISIIPFGIGLIWTIPMLYALYGVLFRKCYAKFLIANVVKTSIELKKDISPPLS